MTKSTKYLVLPFVFFALFKVSAQPSMKEAVPGLYSAKLGSLSISDRHYKQDDESLRWDWVAGDTLFVTLTEDEKILINENIHVWAKNHFEIWVYNELPSQDTFRINFINNSNINQFWFRFNTNYQGWRRLLRSYRHDMQKMFVAYNRNSWTVNSFYIAAPLQGSGTVYLDNIHYITNYEVKESDRTMPDLHELASEKTLGTNKDFYYQLDLLSPPYHIPITTAEDKLQIDVIKERIKAKGLAVGNSPTSTEILQATAEYNAFNIAFTEDGFIKGKDISAPYDIRIPFSIFMREYVNNRTAFSKENATNLLNLMFDNGVAGGSNRWFARSYFERNFLTALINVHLFEDKELNKKIVDLLVWSSDIRLGWKEAPQGSFNTDHVHILKDLFLTIILLSDYDDAVKYSYLLRDYATRFLDEQPGQSDGLKPDGTGFHHAAHYNAYMYAFHTLTVDILAVFEETKFQVDNNALKNLTKMAYGQYIMSNGRQIANSLSGRHPFEAKLTMQANTYVELAKIVGKKDNQPFDPVIAGIYNRLYPNYNSFPIQAERSPSGFWQMNYSPVALYRKNDWLATIKGTNSYSFGTQYLVNQNTYGRYQGYGALEVIYPGGLEESGFVENGWDWSKVPGTTSISLPFSRLMVPSTVTALEQKNTYKFAGAVRFGQPVSKVPSDYILEEFHGEVGLYGFNFREIAYSSSHNSTFTFRKSYFCFDNMILALGSNINNEHATDNTITTLFQNGLSSSSQPIYVNGISRNTNMNESLSRNNNHWMIDGVNNGYYIMRGNNIRIERKQQQSPTKSRDGRVTTGYFASAYIDHGVNPSTQKYAYIVVPDANIAKMQRVYDDMQNNTIVNIVQQDTSAHIVHEKKNDIYAYSLFLRNDSLRNTPFLKANLKPCVTIMQENEDTLRISLVNPDLNFVNNISTVSPVQLVLHGGWSKIPDPMNIDAEIMESSELETSLVFTPKDGKPAFIALYRLNHIILSETEVSLTGITAAGKQQNILTVEAKQDQPTSYSIERFDGNRWTVIDETYSEVTNTRLSLQVTDDKLELPVYTYRVKWLDKNVAKYSNTIQLKNTETGSFSLYPNPANQQINIRFSNFNQNRSVTWQMMDVSGKKVKQGMIRGLQTQVVVSDLSSGNYLIYFSTGEVMKFTIAK